MTLAYKKTGKGKPLLILHGLYGSSDNWVSVARELAKKFIVYSLDLRNHGESPHDDDHGYLSLAADVKEFMEDHGIEKAHVIGHSMGGKTAMVLLAKYPQLVDDMVVVDISYRSYLDEKEAFNHVSIHEGIIRAMQSINTVSLKSKTEAAGQLEKETGNKQVAMFWLKNLEKAEGEGYYWKINLGALEKGIYHVMGSVDQFFTSKEALSNSRVLFINGKKSGYLTKDDFETIPKIFPKATRVTIDDAGHWVHAEKPAEFIDACMNFLTP